MPKPAALALLAVAMMAALLAIIPGRRGAAQQTGSVPTVGRYQVMQGGETRSCYVIDTATGQTWQRLAGRWEDLGSPVVAPK